MLTGGGHKSLISRVSPLNPLNRFQSGFISFVVLNECEGPHCRTDFCTDDAATLLVRLARIANVLSLWLKSEPVRAWKKSKTGWDGEWFISPNNSNVISIQSSFTSSGVYAPLHPASPFLWQQRNGEQRNCRLELRSLILTNFNPRNVNSLRSNSTFPVIVSISEYCSLRKSRG